MPRIAIITTTGVVREAWVQQKTLDDRSTELGQVWELWDEGATYTEIATALKIHHRTAKKRVGQARKLLTTVLRRRPEGWHLAP